MCRWFAYSGGAIPLSRLVFDTEHSLIDQSLTAHSGATTTNGDGFGIGWYDHCDAPGVYKHIQPAWNDPNLQDLCEHVRSPMFVAHVRAATGTAIQQSNCHPFRHGRWLFVHNGSIRGFHRVRRELVLGIVAELFPEVGGTTDSELMFYLALGFGLEQDVVGGVARMVGYVEDVCGKHDIDSPMQMTLGITDGERMYVFRYSSEHRSRTLFYSKSIAALRDLAPPGVRDRLDELSPDARAIVSEPFTKLPDPWNGIPESTCLIVESGEIESIPFAPHSP